MNNETDLLFRLLRLFPVSVIKENFETENRVQNSMINEIIRNYPTEVIINFAVQNFSFTKQHVYFFHSNGNNFRADHGFNPENLRNSTVENEIRTDTYLIRQRYNLVVTSIQNDNISRLNLDFFQPFQIVISPTSFYIRLTILERNPNSYLEDYEVIRYSRENDDDIQISEICNYFQDNLNFGSVVLDINRGVKSLWQNDLIDAISVKYKRDTSVATEVMDENYTFKTQYPERYNEVMASPLRRHTFRFLNNNEDYCDFMTDPSAGTLSFNKYPSNLNQISNVISAILRNNQ